MATRIHIDYETYSEADIKKVGHIAYAMHPSTEILMVSWCGKDGVVRQWANDGDAPSLPPQEFLNLLTDPDYEKWAHNASFEIAITYFVAQRQWGVKIPSFKRWVRQWRCSMVQGMAMSLPGTLAEQGRILGTPIQKQEGGLALIKLFSCPRKPTKRRPETRVYGWQEPERYEQYKSYNRDDVAAEHANYKRAGGFPLPAHEWELWHIDQEINFRGLPIDMDLVEAALEVHDIVQTRLKARMKEITRLENPNSPAQLLPWLMDRGYEYDNLRKANVEKALASYEAPKSGGEYEDDVAKVLDLRLLVSRTSIKKYNALEHAKHTGNRLYGVFQFCGAGRTWRWAGRRFQPQNLPRGIFKNKEQMATAIALIKMRDVDMLDALYDTVNIPDVLASVIRCAIRAEGDKVMTVSDLSSIESVMLAWAANSEYMLDLFRQGLDIYKDFATHWLGVPYNEVTKAMRQLCKPPSLGCGYLLGAVGLLAYADAMGVTLTRQEAKAAVKTYRTAYPDVPQFWEDLDRAARYCIETGEPVTVNGKFTFRRKGPTMLIDLPSGRSLCYIRPAIERRTISYEDIDTGEIKRREVMAITYEGKNQTTNRWERIATHAGKITENIVQAIARDVLAGGIINAYKELPEMDMCLHVHDELGGETPNEPSMLERLEELMTRRPAWGPDIPLGSAGFQNPFYMKD